MSEPSQSWRTWRIPPLEGPIINAVRPLRPRVPRPATLDPDMLDPALLKSIVQASLAQATAATAAATATTLDTATGAAASRPEAMPPGHEHLLQQAREQGHREGYEAGHAQGLAEGHAEGLRAGHAEGHASGQREGRAAGQQQGYDEGHAKGLAKGREAVREQAKGDLERLQQLLDSASQTLEEWADGLGHDLIRLALRIAEQVLQTRLEQDSRYIQDLVRELLRQAPGDQSRLYLHVNPADVAAIEAVLGEDPLPRPRLLVLDATIQRGGCRLQSAEGAIDALLETRWQRVTAALGPTTDAP